jgi:hypothetical protein
VTAPSDKVSDAVRKRIIARSATKTEKGVRLDLRIYLYPEGNSNVHAPGVKDGLSARNDLRLMAQLADVLDLVKRS